MYLERLLQINVATMATLGTLLLGMGQRTASLPLWMLLAAIASVWLTDATGWFRLNRAVVNLAALAAFCVFVWQVSELRGVVRILAIGNLLVYLQIILLFQQKEIRTYWQLVLLSLLQVVVAAAFQQKALFGVLLVVYLFVGLSALVLIFLHRERIGHRPARSRLPAPAAEGRRWPLAGQEPSFTDSSSGFGGQAGIERELRGRVFRMGVGTLAITLALFFILPRWGHQPWRGPTGEQRLAVGFSETVRLGELGRIIEDPEEVLRVQLFDHATSQPYRASGEIYLRGTVLTHYENGAWDYRLPIGFFNVHPLGITPIRTDEELVRQRITIEPLDRPELFCIWPFANADENQKLLVNPGRGLLLRPQDQMDRRFAYELLTPAFHNRMQAVAVPASFRDQFLARFLRGRVPTAGPGAMPGLVALADEWLTRAQLDPQDRLAHARLLERELRDSGRFEYSLEGQQRDPSIDPVEDFVTKNPQGHCEYFATALVLMLRSRGIPARLLVGYKTDEWNGLGSFFQVRQLHAHTWVEAYLEPKHLEGRPDLAGPALNAPYGAWLRLDPTPTGSTVRINPVLDMVGKSFDWLNFLWANYIMEMDQPRQHEAIYDPVGQAIAKTVQRLTDVAWWRSTFASITGALGTGLRRLILGLLLALLGIVLLFVLYLSQIVLRRWLSRFGGRVALGERDARTRVEFYRRLEALLARLGLTRSTSQTQREFAREAGTIIVDATGQQNLAELPVRIVEAFYRVRFGDTPLDNPQAEAVEQALRELRQAVGSGQ